MTFLAMIGAAYAFVCILATFVFFCGVVVGQRADRQMQRLIQKRKQQEQQQ